MRIAILVITLFSSFAAAAASVTTHTGATSQIDSGGTRQAEQSVGMTNALSSSQAIWPPGVLPTVQGRTAARAGNTEIAANASFFETEFGVLAFDEILSQASYSIQATPAITSVNAAVDFFLPPSYLEIVTNGELPNNELEAVILADLRSCLGTVCSTSDRVLQLQATAVSSYRNASYGLILNGDASLDLTALSNPVVTDTGSTGFRRTYLVEFPAFVGHIDVGIIPGGELYTAEYILQARVRGIAQFNSAIAAINDPFTVDTDPVMQGVGITLVTSPVPEPNAWLLLVVALPVIAHGTRRRKPSSQQPTERL